MSYVANIILVTAPEEYDEVKRLADHVRETQGFGDDVPIFYRPTENGGNKHMERDLYISAINNLDVDKFLRHVDEAKWESPEFVQVLICNEHDDKFEDLTL